jgi:copper chaperone CopZ
MTSNITVNQTDTIVLFILGILFIIGVRIVISFFKKPVVPKDFQDMDRVCQSGDRVTLTIDGMMCGMCEIHIKDAIRRAIPDAKNVTASHESGKANFTLSKSETMSNLMASLHETIDPEGYRIIGFTSKN